MDTDPTAVLIRRDVAFRTPAVVLVLTAADAAAEALLFLGRTTTALWAYCALLVGLSLAPLLFETEALVLQAFILLPTFRLVNLSMPVFFDLTLLWLPMIYGPFLLVVVPWWFRRGRRGRVRWLLEESSQFFGSPEEATIARSVLDWVSQGVVLVLLSLLVVFLFGLSAVVGVFLAQVGYDIVEPSPLIRTLDVRQLATLTAVMVVFVGLAEELLFRGVLQQALERRLGVLPGIVLTSCLFGLMHSGYGVPEGIAFGAGVGLLLGTVYDVTGSISLVALMHGVMNVFLFGVIPLGWTLSGPA